MDDFLCESATLAPLQQGQVLVRTIYVSIDTHVRLQMGGTPTFGLPERVWNERFPQFAAGDPIPGYALGEVIDSQDGRLPRGRIVVGYWGWQTHAVARGPGPDADTATSQEQMLDGIQSAWPVDESLVRPISSALHVLGEMGLTAYVGLMEVGKPEPGETVFVTSAAGTIGCIAGQVAKAAGCRVVGSVGSEAKARHILELGFDAAVNYRDPDAAEQLDRACPTGVNVFFDNVGGPFSDVVLSRLADFARVVLCGTLGEMNAFDDQRGVRPYRPMLIRRARMEGFNLWDWPASYDDGLQALATLVQSGELVCPENVVDGFDRVPEVFVDFLGGSFLGKTLVQVGHVPAPSEAQHEVGRGAFGNHKCADANA